MIPPSLDLISTHTRSGPRLRGRSPTSSASYFRVPVALRPYLQVRLEFHAQLHRALRLAAQSHAIDHEEHLIAFHRVDETCQRRVASRQICFHLDGLHSVARGIRWLIPQLIDLHAVCGSHLAEFAVNLRVLGREAIPIEIRDL